MSDDIEYGRIIYKRGDTVELYAGRLISENKDVCIKVLYCETLNDANEIMQESFNMMRFKDQPNIVKIYNSQISQTEDGRYFVRAIMEYYPEGDLQSLIKSHRNNPWTESELIDYLKQLVDAFAYLEEKKVAHRDIKPENIFVTGQGKTLIIGDLGSAREKTIQMSQTIAGTPMYLSPELRRGHMASLSGRALDNFQHDPYKSDVYSLGLTFLYMASLRDCSDLLSLSELQNKTRTRVLEIQRSMPVLGGFLMKMLNFEPRERSSFIQLRSEMSAGTAVTGGGDSINGVIICTCCWRTANSYYKAETSEIVCLSCMSSLNNVLWNTNQK